MRRFFSIWLTFFAQQVKSLLAYRMDFAIGMFALALQQLGSFVVLLAVFTRVTAIGSFKFDEMLLFYGYAQLVRGIDHIYNDNIWTVAFTRIRDGSFSQFLTRPVGVLTQVVIERVQFDGLGEFVLGVVLFGYAYGRLGLAWSAVDWLTLLAFLVAGLAIYFAVKLACASVAFWTVTSIELMTVAYEINGFTRYPLDIYRHPVLRWFLTFVMPFAAVAYFPMIHFLRGDAWAAAVLGFELPFHGFVLALILSIAVTATVLAYALWRVGLRHYNGTGT